jgi:F0F1-type ATP synthase assembly protein I
MSLQQPRQNTNKNFGYALMLGGQLGFMIALPLVICLVIGIVLDKKLDTFPIFLIVFILAGIALTIINIYSSVLPFLEKKVGGKKEKENKE